MSMEKMSETISGGPIRKVYAFVDGFNLYHSLDRFDQGTDETECAKYQQYKWLCLTSLVRKFISADEELVKVMYTAFPDWDSAKRLRHETYVSAQKYMGVEVIKGEFKRHNHNIVCRAACRQEFAVNVEKQTDINISISMIDCADRYDKALLLTADSDQVPTINLLKKLHKQAAVIIPIGRGAKELTRASGQAFKITEQHLRECQLPNPLPIMRDGKQISIIIKPTRWPVLT